MKVIIKAKHIGTETGIVVEANPRLRDFETTMDRIVKTVIKQGFALGIFIKEKSE